MPLIQDKENATFIRDIHNAARDTEQVAAAALAAEQTPDEAHEKTVSDYLSDIQNTD